MVRKVPGQLYEYFLGNELLVAPVYEKGARSRKVFLPEGRWVSYWTGEILNGNAQYMVQAPIDQLPLFVRAGSIIPMRHYASSVEKGNNENLVLHVYPGENGKFDLIEDDGVSNDYLSGKFATTKIKLVKTGNSSELDILPVNGFYKEIIKRRNWEIVIHNKNVSTIYVNGKKYKVELEPATNDPLIKISNFISKKNINVKF